MTTKREFLKLGTLAGAGSLLFTKFGFIRRAFAAIPGVTLDPAAITKYEMPLVIPPAMPKTSGGQVDYYEIAVRQFQQQILPTGMPRTTVWSYGSVNHPNTFNYPAFTIEAKYHRPVRIKWINDLKDANGNFLPHILPVDPTLHWANPPGGASDRDMRPTFESTPGPYTGPVPIVTHLHGGHSAQESDGYAEAWFLPANNIGGVRRSGPGTTRSRPSSSRSGGYPGSRARRRSSTRTTSAPRPSGTTTTRWG
jgi:bilirubin oxidase